MPRVARVAENTEEETPRRFIKGVLACTSNDAATAFSGKTTSVSVAAAKAAAAAAAATATAGVLLERPQRHPATEENVESVQNEATEDIDIVATTPEDAAVSIEYERALPCLGGIWTPYICMAITYSRL